MVLGHTFQLLIMCFQFTTALLAQLGEHWSAEREVARLNWLDHATLIVLETKKEVLHLT